MTTTLALLPLLLAASPQPEVVDRVAAIVNGEVVMLSELTELASAEWARIEAMPDGADKARDRAALLRRAFELVLDAKLLSMAAVKDGIDANEQQVDAAIEEVKTRNNLDQARLEAALAAEGKDMATYRASVKRELDAMLVLDMRVRSRVKLGEDDLKNHYQSHQAEFGGEPEVHLRHIYLPLADDAPPEVEKKVRAEADRVRARLLAGADFEAEARRVSKGASAAEGGELGWVRRGSIDPRVEEAAFSLEPGKLTDWVRVGQGLHVFQVVERRLAGARTFEEAKEEIRNRLYQQQLESFRTQVIAELKKDAVIEAKLPELESPGAQAKAAPAK